MSFEPTKVIEMNKGKQIGNTLMQDASNIPYNNTNVKDELDTINSNLTVNTVTVTSQSGHVTMTLNNTIVQGRTVHLVASASSEETGGRAESDGWLQIQSAYRPNSNRAIGCVIIKPDGTTAIGSAVVGTDGYIKQNVSSKAQYVLFIGTYQYSS